MPRSDGTGLTGPGARTGGRGDRGRGRMGRNRLRAGLSGNGVCLNCGNIVPHETGHPCYAIKRPACGTLMGRG